MSSPTGESQQELLQYFGRHLLALSWYEAELLPDGTNKGNPEFFSASGFVTEIWGRWWIVTAGHVFADHAARRSKKSIKTLQPSIYDCWGVVNEPYHRIPFDFFDESCPVISEFNSDMGLDYALIPINYLVQEAFNKTIVPFRQVDWKSISSQEFQSFFMIGLPLEFAQQTFGEDANELWITTHLSSALIGVAPITHEEAGIPEYPPQFTGRLHPKSKEWIDSIVGMSGGPIIGLTTNDSGQYVYFPVAIQSRWWTQSRIVIGSRLDVIGTLVEGIFEKLANESKESK